MPYLQHPDFKLHYTSEGRGENAVILLHGNFGSQRHWSPFCDNIHHSFSAYAVDFRGCGDSEAPASGYDIETLSEDLYYFVQELNIKPFHLVAHSLGGAVAQQFAAHYPDYLLSLTLVSPVPAEGLASLQSSSFLGKLYSPVSAFELLSSFGLSSPALSATFKKTMPLLKSEPETIKVLVNDAMKMDSKALHGFYDSLKSWTGLSFLDKLRLPVLIIHGELDKVVEAAPIERMAKQLKNCRLSLWPTVGHAPQLEKPEAFKHLVDNFILGSTIASSTEKSQPSPNTQSWFNKFFKKTN